MKKTWIDESYEDVNPEMQVGMTFTIEPIFTEGSSDLKLLEDNWTLVTQDGGWASQFEHTVLVTPTGVEILT